MDFAAMLNNPYDADTIAIPEQIQRIYRKGREGGAKFANKSRLFFGDL